MRWTLSTAWPTSAASGETLDRIRSCLSETDSCVSSTRSVVFSIASWMRFFSPRRRLTPQRIMVDRVLPSEILGLAPVPGYAVPVRLKPALVAAILVGPLSAGCTKEVRRCHELMSSAQDVVKAVDAKDTASVQKSLVAVD